MEENINKLLYHVFEKSFTGSYVNLDYQLFIMSLRSLIPFEKKVGCKFNKERYNIEYKVLKKYFDFESKAYENLINIKQNKNEKDNFILYKILPVVISNTNYNILLNESLRIIVYYTYEVDSIIKTIILSSCLYEYLNDNHDSEDIYNITKQRLIEFSMSKFFEGNFGVKVKNNYIVNFENCRIRYLLLNTLNEFLYNNIHLDLVNKQDEKINMSDENIKILENLGKYLYKLRCGVIDPDRLRLNKELVIDLEKYISNKIFVHPILGKCKIVDNKNNRLDIKTKIGKIKVKI